MNTPSQEPVYTETLTLVERRDEHAGVFTYVFRAANPVQFQAGEYAHIRVLSLPQGTRRVHELSFASSPEDVELWFGVDGRSGSEYQKALQALKPGDSVELFKIRGHMTWLPPVSDIVMIAGGVGITPFRSMMRHAEQKGMNITSTLIHASSGFYMYQEEMKKLVGEYLSVNRADILETIPRTITKHPDAHYYIAGSPSFVQSVVEYLSEKKITKVESDEFKGLLTD